MYVRISLTSSEVRILTSTIPFFISISSSASLIFHSSPAGISLQIRSLKSPFFRSSILVLPAIRINLLERQSCLTIRNILFRTDFEEDSMLSTNLMYLLNNENVICFVLDSGSIKLRYCLRHVP